ncbi:PRE1 20S proteasome alpha and beta subunit [Pyrenophora tritici-repentis]|nr:PRE1 20S proteasome alpha and beta subunit [Pyrenophora tritici-repentis]KAI1580169.1 PRE1 20S proteasome alpha and beta subunit [Pyrenophora tritici-repentis]KAI1588616.1 PRE1 20S proteasome alpha and beta subunit [Pyrenophora tritici-repentis]
MNHLPQAWGRPRDDVYGAYDPSHFSAAGPNQHTQSPIVTGTSVLAAKFKDGVVIAADNLASYGSLARFTDVKRLRKFNDEVVVGFGGDVSDMQYLDRLLNSLDIRENYSSSENSLNAKNLHTYLAKVMYNRRSKFDPLWNHMLIVGMDGEKKPFLASADLLGTTFSSPSLATGFGAHLAQPILRTILPDEAAVENVTREQAVEKIKECMKVLFYRDARSRHVISYLQSHGHTILNVDTVPLPSHTNTSNPPIHTLKADLTDGAQAFNSLSSHFTISEPFPSAPQSPTAVVHFAGIPQPMRVPDNETFRINTLSAYNILEAACKLGIRKIILASSLTCYGVTYAEGDADYAEFPITETTATTPSDVYATSKLCMETLAASFARRFPGTDIYCLRISAVIEPERHEEKFRNYMMYPERFKVHAWSYTDARDLGGMVDACLKKDGLGYQVFNAVNDESTVHEREGGIEEWLGRMCPGTKITRSMGWRESPVCNWKMKEMLGWREEFGWRKVLDGVGWVDEVAQGKKS